MKKIFTLLFGLLFMVNGLVCGAEEDRFVQLLKTPQGWNNRNFAICWFNEKDVYNIASITFCSPGKVIDACISPTCMSFAVLYAVGKNTTVSIFSYETGVIKHSFRSSNAATAIAYSENAKHLCIADMSRTIRVYDLSNNKLLRTIPTAFVPQKICISPNEYYVAAADEQMLYVWNFETGKIRKMLDLNHNVNHVTFSPDNSKMAVLTDNGDLLLYDTKSFSLVDTYPDLQLAKECYFHPEGKYIAVITDTDQVTILNMKNPSEEKQVISTSGMTVSHLGYAKTVKGDIYLVYDAGSKLVMHKLEDLVPDYQQILALKVDEKMDEWLKQMPGESLEDYYLRVNEETRALQYTKFENEEATLLAGDRVQDASISFGSYNQDQNVLEINFDNMPEIYLEVPQEDIVNFSKPENLVFENSVYGVTEDDKFELLYTEVLNTETGKKYIFDNLEKKSLNYLANDDNFVPLDLIQQSSMEEIQLQEIKEEVVTAAQEASLISEHTHIDVKTKVEASTNADGEKIMNYAVEFNYNVEQEFSAQEDFGAGKYIISQSESAMAMLQIVQNAFENQFKQYIVAGKKVKIQVTGSADAAPVNRKLPYGGEYGDYTDALVYAKGELTTLTVTPAMGITTNEQLAFLRAMGVKDYVESHVPALSTMQSEYDCYINVSDKRGTEYRRIGIKFIFVDAF